MSDRLDAALALLRAWLRGRLAPRRVRREIDDEIRHHLDERARSLVAEGWSRTAALKEADRRFGDARRIRRELEQLAALAEAVGKEKPPMLEHLWNDIRYAVRGLAGSPGFTVVAVLTLALGIGANSAIFSVIHGVLLRSLPYTDATRLVLVWETEPSRNLDAQFASAPDYLDIREQATVFDELAGRWQVSRTLTAGGRAAERLSGVRVSAGYFRTLGVAPLHGRDFVEADDDVGAEPVVLLGHALWRQRFGGEPGVVGRTVVLDGMPVEVVGVMPPEAVIASTPDQIWEPLRLTEDESGQRGRHSMLVLGRLRSGVAVADAQAEVGLIMSRLAEIDPDNNNGRGVRIAPLHEELVGSVRPALLVLLGSVGLVLLIACANVANLVMVRSTRRRHELAVRAALGAGRWRLVAQMLVESLVLSLAGGGLGVLVARFGVDALVRLGPAGVPRLDSIGINGVVLAFTAGLSALTGVVFGLLPALRATRSNSSALHEGSGRTGAGLAGGRLRQVLMVGELAVAVVLVLGAGLLIRSYSKVSAVDPGFAAEGVLAASINLPGGAYPFPENWPVLDWPRGNALYDELIREVEALPGVEGAALALQRPVDSGWTTRVIIEGRPEPPPHEQRESRFRPVDTSYFSLLSVPVVQGRGFTRADGPGAPLVAMVNEAFVRQEFPDQDPIGERLRLFGEFREIVGVVPDLRFRGLTRVADAAVYVPLRQNPQSAINLLVRIGADAGETLAALRDILAAIGPELALFRVSTLADTIHRSTAVRRFNMMLLALFAALSLLLAAVGIYGVVSCSVAGRTREIGVRMALGAERADVVAMVLRQGALWIGVGLASGLLAGLAGSRLLETLLFGVGPRDPLTFLTAPAFLALVALTACWLPARRASRVNPLEAIRSE